MDEFEKQSEGENIDQEKLELTRQEKIEAAKKELLNRVVSGNIQNIRDRVAFILNNSPDTRNSDIDLAWDYWMKFESSKLNGNFITREQHKNLTKLSSLSRIRAKIQNEYNLYQADDSVRQFRGVLNEENKKQAVADKPSGIGIYTVYIDETGKTQDFLSVGSLWLVGGINSLYANLALVEWKEKKNLDFEFHFSNCTKHRLKDFQDFFVKFLSLNPAIGFKAIVINNKGFSDKNLAITDLTTHLILRGIHHENDSGRAPLPRILQVWLDEEEKGSDNIKIENIKERLKGQNIEGLHIGDFQAVESKNNFYIQIVDLLTSSINRKLHYPGGIHHKDELADFVLSCLGFDINSVNKENNQIDNSTVFNLTQKEK